MTLDNPNYQVLLSIVQNGTAATFPNHLLETLTKVSGKERIDDGVEATVACSQQVEEGTQDILEFTPVPKKSMDQVVRHKRAPGQDEQRHHNGQYRYNPLQRTKDKGFDHFPLR